MLHGETMIIVLAFVAVIEFAFCSGVSGQQTLGYGERISLLKAKRKNRLEKRNKQNLPLSSNPDCDAVPKEITPDMTTDKLPSNKSKKGPISRKKSLVHPNSENATLTYDSLFGLCAEVSYNEYERRINKFIKMAEGWQNDLYNKLMVEIKTHQDMEIFAILVKFPITTKKYLRDYKRICYKNTYRFNPTGSAGNSDKDLPMAPLFDNICWLSQQQIDNKMINSDSFKNDAKITINNIVKLLTTNKFMEIDVESGFNPETFVLLLKKRTENTTTADIFRLMLSYNDALLFIQMKFTLIRKRYGECFDEFEADGRSGNDLFNDSHFKPLFDEKGKFGIEFNFGRLEEFYKNNNGSIYIKNMNLHVAEMKSTLDQLKDVLDALKRKMAEFSKDLPKKKGSEKSKR